MYIKIEISGEFVESHDFFLSITVHGWKQVFLNLSRGLFTIVVFVFALKLDLNWKNYSLFGNEFFNPKSC